MWPIFYGIMFADLGHGLLLMGLGLLFKFKGQGNLSRWGMLLAMSGAAGAIAGVFQGEAFGFHLEYFEPFGTLLHEGGPLHSISWLVGSITVAQLTFRTSNHDTQSFNLPRSYSSRMGIHLTYSYRY